jgi:hypothetical protein
MANLIILLYNIHIVSPPFKAKGITYISIIIQSFVNCFVVSQDVILPCDIILKQPREKILTPYILI